MNHNSFLSHQQVANFIKNVGPKRTVLILGENGIGKSSLYHTLAQDPDFDDHIKVDPIDCTQLSDGSLFMPDLDRERGVSTELPNERLGVGKHNPVVHPMEKAGIFFPEREPLFIAPGSESVTPALEAVDAGECVVGDFPPIVIGASHLALVLRP